MSPCRCRDNQPSKPRINSAASLLHLRRGVSLKVHCGYQMWTFQNLGSKQHCVCCYVNGSALEGLSLGVALQVRNDRRTKGLWLDRVRELLLPFDGFWRSPPVGLSHARIGRNPYEGSPFPPLQASYSASQVYHLMPHYQPD
jgi:hypothetical protein